MYREWRAFQIRLASEKQYKRPEGAEMQWLVIHLDENHLRQRKPSVKALRQDGFKGWRKAMRTAEK